MSWPSTRLSLPYLSGLQRGHPVEVVGRRFSGRMRLGVEHCCFSIQSAWWKDMTSHKSCATLAYFEPAEVTSWPKLHICHEGNKHARPSDPILPQRKRKEKGETCTTNMYPLQPLPHSCSLSLIFRMRPSLYWAFQKTRLHRRCLHCTETKEIWVQLKVITGPHAQLLLVVHIRSYQVLSLSGCCFQCPFGSSKLPCCTSH